MSQLCLHRPHSVTPPHILSFAEAKAARERDEAWRTRTRARLEHHNQSCPDCGRITVEPIELDDSIRSRNGSIIPRSATVVGFSCLACHSIWRG